MSRLKNMFSSVKSNSPNQLPTINNFLQVFFKISFYFISSNFYKVSLTLFLVFLMQTIRSMGTELDFFVLPQLFLFLSYLFYFFSRGSLRGQMSRSVTRWFDYRNFCYSTVRKFLQVLKQWPLKISFFLCDIASNRPPIRK